MSDDLDALYQKRILERGERARASKLPEPRTHEVRVTNPLCGDRVRFGLRVEDAHVRAAGFEAQGCLISLAAASWLADAIVDAEPAEVRALLAEYRAMIDDGAEPTEALGELGTLSVVRRFPARLRCATLPAEAIEKMLAEDDDGAD